jgi:DNA topoisomerase-1
MTTSRRFDARANGEVAPVTAAIRYGSDEEPGFRRRRAGRGFVYTRPSGARVRDAATLERIRALAVPPAWTDVWIAADPLSHVQAVGRDARGRKQYRYHSAWRAAQEATKYERLLEFGGALPAVRKRLHEDLSGRALDHDLVVATVVHLLEISLIRVGNDEYTRTNGSYGLTTLRSRQVTVEGSGMQFAFVGKSGQRHVVSVREPRVARVVRRCQELPGQRLFQYEGGDGRLHAVTSDDVNAYLRAATGEELTAKDFRTWMGTLFTAVALVELPPPASASEGQRLVKEAVAITAQHLGNTPAVARNSYVHPDVVDLYLEGSLPDLWDGGPARPTRWLITEERKLLTVLRAARRRQRRAA